MKEHLEQFVKKVKERHGFCAGNEATTKASLISPLFAILGWDMTDPQECHPEYRADFGKGERAATPVDWAFCLPPIFAFIVEAKECSKRLKSYAEQLGMYFAKASVKLGIYTNGVQWQFYTDLDKENIMDKEPFLSWSILDDDPIPYDFLTLLQKSQFQAQLIKTFAEKGRKQSLLIDALTKLFWLGVKVFYKNYFFSDSSQHCPSTLKGIDAFSGRSFCPIYLLQHCPSTLKGINLNWDVVACEESVPST